MSYIEQETARLRLYQIERKPDCRLCQCWFLGCLNGRKRWTDKPVTPNKRFAGQGGEEYAAENVLAIPAEEYPLRMFCDAFEWDREPHRLGRIVY